MFNELKEKLFGQGQAASVASDPATLLLSQRAAIAEGATWVAQGNALLDQGKPGQAAECYRRAGELNPGDVGAFINLGFALTEQGLHAEAQAPLRQAIELNSESPDAFYVLGTCCKECGDADGAIENYTRTLELRADFPLCRRDLGRLLVDTGKTERAKELIRAGIALTPGIADFHFYLGNLLRGEGDLEAAVESFGNALSIQPSYPEALTSLGSALHALGDLDAAVASFNSAISLKPAYAEAHFNLGVSLHEQDRLDLAIESLNRAISLDPSRAVAHYVLANALQDQGNLDRAFEHYNHALTLQPAYAEAHNNLGSLLQKQGELDLAIDSYRRAIAIKWDYPAAHCNMATAFHLQNDFAAAIESYRNSVDIDPGNIRALVYLGGACQDGGDLDASVENYQRVLAISPDHDDAHSNLLFTLNYHPDRSAEEIYGAYQYYDRCLGLPLRSHWKAHANDRATARRLRIGYVSPDLRQHSVRHFLEPLMAHHDKAAVEVFAYAELAQEDAVTARYRGYADHWIPTLGMTDDALAERIRADHIDILVDLAGHTAKHRLGVFARKPAPVSVSWMGFGYTTGLSAIDYMLTDAVAAPPGSEHLFSEKPWRLPHPPYAVFRPAEGMGAVNALPALERGFVTFGTLTRAVRINHRTIRVWAQILKRVPDALLVVDSKNFQDPGMRASLEAKFAAHGIGPEQLDLGFHSPPWDVLRGLDIGLDCFPHNSGTTLFETLYMGVPFVTLAERPSVGRLGSSILHGVGHPQWIAQTEEEYVEIAVALAGDLDALAALRANLRPQMEASALRDEVGFTRSVEAAYREMFAFWSAGAAEKR